MSEHTPGPWHIVAASGGGTYISDSGRIIARADYMVDDEDAANARLIATAPALLEALEAVVADYQFSSGEFPLERVYSPTHPVMQAVAAIKQARDE